MGDTEGRKHAFCRPVRPSILINKAAFTARHSTSTEKIAALLVSVSFVNRSEALSPTEEVAG